MIKTAIRFIGEDTKTEDCAGCSEVETRPPSGMMVVVFDNKGEQIPRYQGRYETVKESILHDAPPDTLFVHGLNAARGLKVVSREQW